MEQGNAQDLQVLLAHLETFLQKHIILQLRQLGPDLVTQFILKSEIPSLTEFIILLREIDLSAAQAFVQSCAAANWTIVLSKAPRIEMRWLFSILRSLVPSLATEIISELQNVWDLGDSSEYELNDALLDDKWKIQED